MDNNPLLELIEKKIPDLNRPEMDLLGALLDGRFVDLIPDREETLEPCHEEDWSEERVIRSIVISTICATTIGHEYIHPKGLQIRGGIIKDSLDLENIQFPFPIRFHQCLFEQKISLSYAKITELDLSGCCTKDIYARGLSTQGRVMLTDNFHAQGEIHLGNAKLGNYLNCTNGKFENQSGHALHGLRMRVEGDVSLEGVEVNGCVYFYGAKIDGHMICVNGKFNNPENIALNAEGMKVGGAIMLSDGFVANGGVRLYESEVMSNLNCENSIFRNPEGDAFDAEGIKVNGTFYWENITEKPEGKIVLKNAHVSVLQDDPQSWPDNSCIQMEGFECGSITSSKAMDINHRLKWLDLQDPEHFSTQPYEQFIHLYRSQGLERQAKRFGIEKQKALRKHGSLPLLSKIWNWLLGLFIDHGYSPEKAILWMLVPITLGAILFNAAFDQGLMTRTQGQVTFVKDELEVEVPYPTFISLAYSLDAFMPIVDLHQESYWLPNNSIIGGPGYLYYYWIHIGMGWFLTSLAVAAITGIVRKD